MIEINEIQQDFLRTACNLHWAVIQFDITDKDFLEDYWYTKEEYREAINDLITKLR